MSKRDRIVYPKPFVCVILRQAQDDKNGQAQDDKNGQAQDDKNGQAQDDRKRQAQDERKRQAQDDRKRQAQDDKNRQAQDDKNRQAQDDKTDKLILRRAQDDRRNVTLSLSKREFIEMVLVTFSGNRFRIARKFIRKFFNNISSLNIFIKPPYI